LVKMCLHVSLELQFPQWTVLPHEIVGGRVGSKPTLGGCKGCVDSQLALILGGARNRPLSDQFLSAFKPNLNHVRLLLTSARRNFQWCCPNSLISIGAFFYHVQDIKVV
jgi:hypothetical protein